jgi:hypothetical protein
VITYWLSNGQQDEFSGKLGVTQVGGRKVDRPMARKGCGGAATGRTTAKRGDLVHHLPHGSPDHSL